MVGPKRCGFKCHVVAVVASQLNVQESWLCSKSIESKCCLCHPNPIKILRWPLTDVNPEFERYIGGRCTAFHRFSPSHVAAREKEMKNTSRRNVTPSVSYHQIKSNIHFRTTQMQVIIKLCTQFYIVILVFDMPYLNFRFPEKTIIHHC